MKKKLDIQHFLLYCCILLLGGCDLTENMKVDADKAMIFGSESGLRLYAYSFYRALPTLDDGYKQDETCDLAAVRNTSSFIQYNAYNAETATSWSWSTLRNINYFIDGCNSDECTVDEDTRNNYLGIARWFRAYFYYDKLVTYGEVPWFANEIQSYQTDVMYKERDSRDVIIRNMIEDLDFAYEHIQATASENSSTLTKWAAAALKSRVCLFEASYRRYHQLEGLEISTDKLFNEAADAAKLVMDNSGLSLNTAVGTKGAYRDLFYREEPITQEVILAVCANNGSGILGTQNWWYNSQSRGKGWSLVRPFINTYLKIDGTPFTSDAGYETKNFAEEIKGRDLRLSQTIRGADFKLDGKVTAADMSVCLTGYHVIKYSLDESQYDNGKNINSIPLIRYAEVLLNYAESLAELGKITDNEWNRTIGALRQRAGITGGIDKLPTVIDSYLQNTFYPSVTNPVLLEIRRERAIELVAEGLRFSDLCRWKCGELIATLPWMGIHIDALNTDVDLNGDGIFDCYFTNNGTSSSTKDCLTVNVKNTTGICFKTNDRGGYDLQYNPGEGNRYWYADDRQYLYPVPAQVIRDYESAGYKLSQNPYWN